MYCFNSYPATRRGFTLIELLVVISIIALLIGLLLPTLGLVRNTAKQCRDFSNLRQIMVGYSVYQNDYRDHVMWGYPPPTVDGELIQARLPNGSVTSGLSVQRYPWRLIPYLNNAWPLLNSDPSLTEDPIANEYPLSLLPSYGLNATYVGGSTHTGSNGFVGDTPNRGEHVVFKNGEVRRGSDLIVFAEAQAHANGNIADGSYFLDPPRKGNVEAWRAESGEVISERPSVNTGLPVGRYTSAISTAFFDGHVASVDPPTLDDMRLWANGADDADYDHTN